MLRDEVQIAFDKPELKSQKVKSGQNYWLEFDFFNHYDTLYKLSEIGLKYSLYNDILIRA
ncbi:hypothetical protein BH10BAC2_BH10BAC2_06620 [soil metagenome]